MYACRVLPAFSVTGVVALMLPMLVPSSVMFGLLASITAESVIAALVVFVKFTVSVTHGSVVEFVIGIVVVPFTVRPVPRLTSVLPFCGPGTATPFKWIDTFWH